MPVHFGKGFRFLLRISLVPNSLLDLLAASTSLTAPEAAKTSDATISTANRRTPQI